MVENGLAVQARHEDGVRSSHFDANAVNEREVGRLEVMRTPPKQDGVEGDDKRLEAIGFRSSKN